MAPVIQWVEGALAQALGLDLGTMIAVISVLGVRCCTGLFQVTLTLTTEDTRSKIKGQSLRSYSKLSGKSGI